MQIYKIVTLTFVLSFVAIILRSVNYKYII